MPRLKVNNPKKRRIGSRIAEDRIAARVPAVDDEITKDPIIKGNDEAYK